MRPHIWQFTDNFGGLDASISTLTLDQLAHGGRKPTPQEDDMLSGTLTGGAGEKPPIVCKSGAFGHIALAWDNTLALTDPPVVRAAPARIRLAPHQAGRKGTTVEATVGAALTDSRGRPDVVTVALPAGCDYVSIVRLDDSPRPVGFCIY